MTQVCASTCDLCPVDVVGTYSNGTSSTDGENAVAKRSANGGMRKCYTFKAENMLQQV